MKFLKGFLTFILAVVLFVLIFALSLVFRTKSFVEKEVIVSTVNEAITNQIDTQDLTTEQRNLIDSLKKDKDTEKLIQKAVENFVEYKTESNYYLKESDYNLLIDYITKHLDEINAVSDTSYSASEVKEMLKYDEMKDGVNELFDQLSDQMGDNETVDNVVRVYSKTTSNKTMILIGLGIVVTILAIVLINWSFIKWMLVVGIDLIISGALIGIIYILASMGKKLVVAEETIKPYIESININGFMFMAVGEIVFGIVLIVIYSIIKKKGKKDE